MPLLNKRRVPLAPNIPCDPKRQRKEVWYLHFTNEVFTNYESYINKLTLYHQPIWECEATGRQHLTYEQALESEKTEHDRAEFKFCQPLRIHILNRIKFQTVRLDVLVNDVYSYFKTNFVVDEIVHCKLNGYNYLARIVQVLPKRSNDYQHSLTWTKKSAESSSVSNSESEDDSNVPRQPNGRLRFPDAFLHPTPQSPSHSENDSMPDPQSDHDTDTCQYKVQLIDESNQPLENCTRIVESTDIKREKNVFNRSNVQCFIRECSYKDNYINAPWLIKAAIASTYDIDTRLPEHLQQAQDKLYEKTSKKRKIVVPTKTPDEREAEKRARKEESLLQKAKLKEERERLREEKKKQAAVKYPLEDLDLPIYRKDPNLNWLLIDMSPLKFDVKDAIIPYPSGGRAQRPNPHNDSAIPPELFDSFLSIWAFLTVFAEPLKVSAYSVDEFERALFHNSHQPKATVLVEYNACLLNVIINERKEDTINEIINGEVMETYVESLEEDNEDEGSDDEDQDNEKCNNGSKLKNNIPDTFVLPKIERGWRDKEHLRISQKWDHKELRANYDRRGWETSLIGCLNDVSTPDLIPDLDDLLRHLVPRIGSTAADREKQYPTLSIKQKLDIMIFLVDVVNESNLIKNYMEYCQEQLSEFRKQKVELNKESKALSVRRIEMDKRDKAEKSEETSDEDDSDDSSDSDDSENESHDNSDIDSDSSERRLANRERRHLSRQEKLKQKQREREEMETQRKKMYAEQRQVAKAKNQEQRIKASERRKLEEEERILKKKEEHLEKSMRRYMTLRIRPLGKDRFNNRYFYLDNVGVANTYGSGRLYISSPTDGDIQMMMERDFVADLPDQPWGYGGGRWFILKLMREQGLAEESIWLENRMNELNTGNASEYKGWWKYYSDPEEIQQLLSWLNPKGFREHKLKCELAKQEANIIKSMKKRAHALTKTEAITKRATRAKSSVHSDSTWSSKA
ncbi:ATP-utilizing chromatin assembly and remodelling N-terminal-domain-containing protein [Thamnidium elegans]|uniref:DDT domain-containing protein n=1 Tax=Thamnidium elegans TaxID=101142 RepID=A0A8H7SIF3_9FUNG|nr:hypothetical protein INT48_001621 [Thamnidium elegans]KAI8073734.1 ATP-utilizing chromatin assembly and remodelling N-terminal-domain-containing protein [Thamnidium elegans]